MPGWQGSPAVPRNDDFDDHERDREFPAALICWHGFVGYEVEDTAAMSEASLLDLVLAHALPVVGDEDRGPRTEDRRPKTEDRGPGNTIYSRAHALSPRALKLGPRP